MNGLLIVNGTGTALISPTTEELTHAISDALNASKQNVQQPDNLTSMDIPEWVRSRKIKSWNALEKGSRLYGIQLRREELVIEINQPYKSGGFVVERVENHPANSLSHIGTILLKLKEGEV